MSSVLSFTRSLSSLTRPCRSLALTHSFLPHLDTTLHTDWRRWESDIDYGTPRDRQGRWMDINLMSYLSIYPIYSYYYYVSYILLLLLYIISVSLLLLSVHHSFLRLIQISHIRVGSTPYYFPDCWYLLSDGYRLTIREGRRIRKWSTYETNKESLIYPFTRPGLHQLNLMYLSYSSLMRSLQL